ncbi:MAG: lipopolysaccharide biosynthesis protein [Phycisphaerae bacterium]|nr:lipopolysaccharide biosynthesis protein [Phycisphaerae bacterium]
MQDEIINDTAKSSPDLFKRSARGGAWVFALRILTQVLSLGRYVLLMNILGVKDMGLLGIAMLLMQILDTFSNTGFNAALIQKNKKLDSYLSTAWTIGIIRAFFLFAILFVVAPHFANWKADPEKTLLTIKVIRVLGLSFLIGALGNIGIIHFQKELQFHKQFLIQIVPAFISIIVTVVLVLIYKSIWSLVIGRISANIFRCVFSYSMHPFRPKFQIDTYKAKEMWHFGKWEFCSTILGFILTDGDDFYVLAAIGSGALALYQAAYRYSNIPATEITNVISQVSFPAYSKLQNDIPRIRQAYLKIFGLTSFLSIPVSGMIFILTPFFVKLCFQVSWWPMIPAMQVLALKGLVRSLGATRGPLFQALGLPGITTKLHIIRVLLMAILIYPLTSRWGILGTAWCITIIGVIMQPFGVYLSVKVLKSSFYEILKPAFIPSVGTLSMLLIMWLVGRIYGEINLISFVPIAIIGIVVYLLTIYIMDMVFGHGFKKNIFELLASVIRR